LVVVSDCLVGWRRSRWFFSEILPPVQPAVGRFRHGRFPLAGTGGIGGTRPLGYPSQCACVPSHCGGPLEALMGTRSASGPPSCLTAIGALDCPAALNLPSGRCFGTFPPSTCCRSLPLRTLPASRRGGTGGTRPSATPHSACVPSHCGGPLEALMGTRSAFGLPSCLAATGTLDCPAALTFPAVVQCFWRPSRPPQGQSFPSCPSPLTADTPSGAASSGG